MTAIATDPTDYSILLPASNIVAEEFSLEDFVRSLDEAGFFELCSLIGVPNTIDRVAERTFPVTVPASDPSRALLAMAALLRQHSLSAGGYLGALSRRVGSATRSVAEEVRKITLASGTAIGDRIYLKRAGSSGGLAVWHHLDPGYVVEFGDGSRKSYDSIPQIVGDGWYLD